MKLQEYQSKALFAEHGIRIPRGQVATTPEGVRRFAQDLGRAVAVKAQVLIGGRGKAGGVRLAATPSAAGDAAAAVLGMEIRGLPVRELLVEESVGIEQEIYLGIVLDRTSRQPLMMASGEGGVDIEQVSRDRPEAISKVAIDPLEGLRHGETLTLAKRIGLRAELRHAFRDMAHALYEVFRAYDGLLVEINPLVVTDEGELLALDAKIVIDDNALFRQPEILRMRTDAESDGGDETPVEHEAQAGLVARFRQDGYHGPSTRPR